MQDISRDILVNVLFNYLPIDDLYRIRGVNGDFRYAYFVYLLRKIRSGDNLEDVAVEKDNIYMLFHVFELQEQTQPGSTILTLKNREPWIKNTMKKAFKSRSLSLLEYLVDQTSLENFWEAYKEWYDEAPRDNKPRFITMFLGSKYLLSLMIIYAASETNAEKYLHPLGIHQMLCNDAKNNIVDYVKACEMLHEIELATTSVMESGIKATSGMINVNPRNMTYHQSMKRLLDIYPLRTITRVGTRSNKNNCLAFQDKLAGMAVQPHHKRELQDRKLIIEILCDLPINNQ